MPTPGRPGRPRARQVGVGAHWAAALSATLPATSATALTRLGYAISRADLVIVPTQGSLLDATEAANAIRLVRNQEKASGRTIPTAVLFTRTSAALKPRSLRAIADELAQAGVRVLDAQMHERDAFRAIFSFGGSLADLDPAQVSNIPAAVAVAETRAAQETAKAEGAIAKLSAITRLRARAAALSDGGSRDKRGHGSTMGFPTTRVGQS